MLVVEDDPDLAANLGDFLELRGHSVDFAATAHQGKELAGAQRFDAIVLDRLLPGVDGADLCRALRASGHGTPILMLTALDKVEQRVEGLAAGADDYLVKPFAMDELMARLDALHRRATRRVAPAGLRLADLEYDPATMIATRANRQLDLSPSVRKILEYLLRHQDRVVTRTELCELLWGDPEVDALRGHIHELRRALDRPFGRPLLHTMRGGGWRLMETDRG
ncbi:MAG TPA: response regulator transcription factor [Candidatus Eisenbacteria bacterium]